MSSCNILMSSKWRRSESRTTNGERHHFCWPSCAMARRSARSNFATGAMIASERRSAYRELSSGDEFPSERSGEDRQARAESRLLERAVSEYLTDLASVPVRVIYRSSPEGKRFPTAVERRPRPEWCENLRRNPKRPLIPPATSPSPDTWDATGGHRCARSHW